MVPIFQIESITKLKVLFFKIWTAIRIFIMKLGIGSVYKLGLGLGIGIRIG